VPRTLHTQLEIAKAIRTLADDDQSDAERRRSEIAALRRDCEALKLDLQKAGEEWLALVKTELVAELKKYSADQPRVPKGNRDGGQWTSGGKTGGEASLDQSDDEANGANGLRTRYAQVDTHIRTDATGIGSNVSNTGAYDASIRGNLPGVMWTLR